MYKDEKYTRSLLNINLAKKHKTDLGMQTPEDFFANTAESILAQTVHKKSKKVFVLQKKYIFAVAASVSLLLTLAVFNPFKQQDSIIIEEDVLLASLVIENDAEADMLITDFVDDNLLTEEVFVE